MSWDWNSLSRVAWSDQHESSVFWSTIAEANCLDQSADESMDYGWDVPKVLRFDRAKSDQVVASRHIPEKALCDLIDGRD